MSGPLAGLRIAVTRPREQAAELADKLAALGAVPILLPTVQIVPAADPARLDAAIARLQDFDWLLFTSHNGVAALAERLTASRPDGAPRGPKPRVAAVGPVTAEAARQAGFRVSVVPEQHIAEGLLAALGDVHGLRILIPRSALARDLLASELRARGALVTDIAAYSNVRATLSPAALAALNAGADAVTFTSSSAVRGYVELAAEAGLQLSAAAFFCIGPATARTAVALGLAVAATARPHTIDGLLAALVEYYSPP